MYVHGIDRGLDSFACRRLTYKCIVPRDTFADAFFANNFFPTFFQNFLSFSFSLRSARVSRPEEFLKSNVLDTSSLSRINYRSLGPTARSIRNIFMQAVKQKRQLGQQLYLLRSRDYKSLINARV